MVQWLSVAAAPIVVIAWLLKNSVWRTVLSSFGFVGACATCSAASPNHGTCRRHAMDPQTFH